MLHTLIHKLIAHFIPHEGNDYRPHLLQRAAMVGMVGLVFLSFMVANVQALLWESSKWLVGAVLPAVVVELTNNERNTQALVPLMRSAVLDRAAQLKADDMAKNSYFSHDSPTGVTPWHWFNEANYPFVYAGENLAVYFTDSSEVVDAWMRSPTHRANIVNANYREIGMGTARGRYNGYDTIFVVQLFGTPAIPAVAPVVIAGAAFPATTSARLAVVGTAAPMVPAGVKPVLGTTTAVKNALPLVAGEMIDITMSTQASNSQSTIVSTVSNRRVDTAGPAVTSTTLDTAAPRDVAYLYTEMAASSTNLVPAPQATLQSLGGTTAPMMARLATQPNTVLQSIYLLLGLLTALALVASVLLEWRHHRPVQTGYGLALLILMTGLFYVHTMTTAGALVL